MRRFVFNRIEDASGVSGTGTVVEGVQFTSGKVVLTWLRDISAITIYQSIDDALAIDGHEGRTILAWIDSGSHYEEKGEKSEKSR